MDVRMVEGASSGALSAPARRTERVLGVVRVLSGVWGILLVLSYPDMPAAYEARIEAASLGLLGGFLLASGVIWAALELPRVRYDVHRAAVVGLALDTVTATGVAFAFGFDKTSAVWIILFLLPVEGAMRFQLRGAAITLVIAAAGYVGREIAWARWIDEEIVEVRSIVFRMAVVGIVTVFVGQISDQLRQEREIAQAALARVERSDQWRSHLVSALGHDLRSPLATVEMQARALVEMELTPEQRRAMAEGIQRQSRRLARLADGILDMALAEVAQLTLRPAAVEVGPLLHEVVDLVGMADEVTVASPAGLQVHADPDRLAQVVMNLLGNAKRHGSGPVELSADRVGGNLGLVVRDHGPGIAPEVRATMFEAFGRGQTEGSIGLGLYLVFTIVDAHGGEVEVEDASPGARFRVTLPGASIVEVDEGRAAVEV